MTTLQFPKEFWGKYQTHTPLGITVKATLPNMLWSFEQAKANISQHYSNSVG